MFPKFNNMAHFASSKTTAIARLISCLFDTLAPSQSDLELLFLLFTAGHFFKCSPIWDGSPCFSILPTTDTEQAERSTGSN